MPVFDPDSRPEAESIGSLYSGEPEYVQSRPWWLVEGPPSFTKSRWPSGAKSPSWLKKLLTCALQHAQRYRYSVPDPPGPEATTGKLVHGALLGAALRRVMVSKRKAVPEHASTEELLHLLEFVLPCCGNLVNDGHSRDCKPTPLDAGAAQKARDVIRSMKPIQFRGVMAVEHLVQVHVSHSLLIAGYIDILQLDEGTYEDPKLLTITDYKTGPGHVPDELDVFYDPQCQSYLCAIKRLYPNARVRFRIWNVTQDKDVIVEWSRKLEETFFTTARMLYNRWNASDERPTVGEHCDFCFHRLKCQAYTEHLKNKSVLPDSTSLESLSVPELIYTYRESAVTAGMAEARRKDCSKLLMARIPQELRQYNVGHLRALRKLNPRRILATSASAVLRDCASTAGVDPLELLDQVGEVSLTKLESWIESLPEDRKAAVLSRFETHVSRGYTRAHIEVKEVKSKLVF